jgi:hypothetical protein
MVMVIVRLLLGENHRLRLGRGKKLAPELAPDRKERLGINRD